MIKKALRELAKVALYLVILAVGALGIVAWSNICVEVGETIQQAIQEIE